MIHLIQGSSILCRHFYDEYECFSSDWRGDESKEEISHWMTSDAEREKVKRFHIRPNATRDFRIPAELFSVYPNLDNMFIESGINQLSFDSFNNLTKLKRLFVASNDLRELRAGVFPATLKLHDLDFRNNQIEYIDDFTFASLSSLQVLSIHGNKLTTIKRNMFGGLFELKSLALSANRIDRIEHGAFGDLRTLETLNLIQNEIKFLDEQVFRGPVALNTLLLGHNRIRDIRSYLYTLTTIEALSLESNLINNIDITMFARLPKLKKLNLRATGVQLRNVDVGRDIAFQSQLIFLDLENNNLTNASDLDVLVVFPNLSYLDLSGNDYKNKDIVEHYLRLILRYIDYLDI